MRHQIDYASESFRCPFDGVDNYRELREVLSDKLSKHWVTEFMHKRINSLHLINLVYALLIKSAVHELISAWLS